MVSYVTNTTPVSVFDIMLPVLCANADLFGTRQNERTRDPKGRASLPFLIKVAYAYTIGGGVAVAVASVSFALR